MPRIPRSFIRLRSAAATLVSTTATPRAVAPICEMASSREGGIDLPSTARANDQKLAAERGSGRAKLARVRLGIRIGGVHEEADRSGFRDSFVQHLELLGGKQVGQKAHSGDIATRPVEAGGEYEFNWMT